MHVYMTYMCIVNASTLYKVQIGKSVPTVCLTLYSKDQLGGHWIKNERCHTPVMTCLVCYIGAHLSPKPYLL